MEPCIYRIYVGLPALGLQAKHWPNSHRYSYSPAVRPISPYRELRTLAKAYPKIYGIIRVPVTFKDPTRSRKEKP